MDHSHAISNHASERYLLGEMSEPERFDFEAHYFECVECAEDVVVRDQTAQTHLFRLAQEAVNNSVKHGKAKKVQISLKMADERYVLSISDDGVGLPAEGPKLKGLGLRIMNYRAQKVGGTFAVEAAHPRGTVVRCTFGRC